MAASTSTPSSAGSPTNIAPAPLTFAVRPTMIGSMAAVAQTTAVPVSSIGPTKNWVIPPRPKPGRKPATDTPPTKRKAQNRAAQRAFRERRAARVGELEEQLKETEEERQKRESAMHDQITEQNAEISRLEEDIHRLRNNVTTWRSRYFELQRRFEDERNDKDAALTELAFLRHGSRSLGTDAVPLPPRRQQAQQKTQLTPIPQLESPADPVSEPVGCGGCTTTSSCACMETAMSIAASGCGKCTVGSRCECIDDTLKSVDSDILLQADLKRPLPTAPDSYDLKRPRFSIEQSLQQEIDFTTPFSQTRPRIMGHKSSQDQIIPSASRAPAESCGFCAEGTYCACAEAEGTSNQTVELENENRLAPLSNEVTPPPSDTDVSSPDANGFKLPSLYPNHRIQHPVQPEPDQPLIIRKLLAAPTKTANPSSGSCARGPGSCKQCQEDPRSGLFCRSLASMRASNNTASDPPSNCCGGVNAAGGGCSKTQEQISTISLSCEETYKTLATHKNFDIASDNIGDWLPKLHTALPRYPGRAPLDIEAASVMNVIKYLDVRFGRN